MWRKWNVWNCLKGEFTVYVCLHEKNTEIGVCLHLFVCLCKLVRKGQRECFGNDKWRRIDCLHRFVYTWEKRALVFVCYACLFVLKEMEILNRGMFGSVNWRRMDCLHMFVYTKKLVIVCLCLFVCLCVGRGNEKKNIWKWKVKKYNCLHTFLNAKKKRKLAFVCFCLFVCLFVRRK